MTMIRHLAIDPNNLMLFTTKGNAIAKLVESTNNITPVLFRFNNQYDAVINYYNNNGFFQISRVNSGVNSNLDGYFYFTSSDNSNNYYYLAFTGIAAAVSTLNYEDAIKAYDKVLAKNPDDIVTLNNKGMVLIKEQKYNDAIVIFSKILELDPDNVPGLYNMGLALENYGDRYDGPLYKNRALELDSHKN